ncbi:hypothetical protein NJC08_27500, partial [Pseudomonas fluorescens]|nr:hypothetical protein [Pseudomonas fluorescens]
QIKDGTTVKGEATVNLTTGLWELTLTGLSLAAHSFTAIALYGGGQVSAAWTLTVTANTPPTITKAIDSKGATIVKGGFTVDTQITLSGAGAKGQKVQIKDGTTIKGEATVNPTTGLWELTLTGLSVAAHSFTAVALYGSGQVSAAWTLTVTANTALTITSVKDQSNWNIPDNGHTVHTSVTLTGSAPVGQKVEVFLGAISKGIAEAGPDRTWTRTVSGLSLDVLHTLKAVGQYANNPTSNLWRLTALNGVRPAITAAQDSKGQPISNGGNTVDRTVHLMGTATKYLEVEIYDGATATGKKARANDKGEWAVQLTGLTPTKHVFKAKALYGSGTESGEWAVTVVNEILLENFDSRPQQEHKPGTPLIIPTMTVTSSNTNVGIIPSPNYSAGMKEGMILVIFTRGTAYITFKSEYSYIKFSGSFSDVTTLTFYSSNDTRLGERRPPHGRPTPITWVEFQAPEGEKVSYIDINQTASAFTQSHFDYFYIRP